MLRLLTDENVAPAVAAALRERGFDVAAVRDIAAGMNDIEVMERATIERRIIITHDRDFGNILRFPMREHFGVILIRLRDQHPNTVVRRLLPVLMQHDGEEFTQRIVIIRESIVRFLPRQE